VAQLAERVALGGLLEVLVGEVREALPGWVTLLVALQPEEALLTSALHVKRSHQYLLDLRVSGYLKKL
jgi:hypothetical protein